ncbi:MAG: UPF0147 family protein [Candidatus Aenigmatarchaeota archaeon]
MGEKNGLDFSPVNGLLEQILNDRTVPKNIRAAAEQAKAVIDGATSDELKVSAAVSTLDEIINDPNMPMYTRTQIWNIVSMLEQLRRKLE